MDPKPQEFSSMPSQRAPTLCTKALEDFRTSDQDVHCVNVCHPGPSAHLAVSAHKKREAGWGWEGRRVVFCTAEPWPSYPPQRRCSQLLTLPGRQRQDKVDRQRHRSLTLTEREAKFFIIARQHSQTLLHVPVSKTPSMWLRFAPRLDGKANSSGQASTEYVVSFLLLCPPIAQLLI